MGFFKSKDKIDIDKSMFDRIQFQLNNNSNIEVDRKVYVDVKFPYNDKLSVVDMLMLTTKGIFLFIPLMKEGEYIGGEFETMWIIKESKIYNPIEQTKKQIGKLSEFLKIKRENIIPYIVITNKSTIRDIPYCKKNYRIVKENDLYYFLGLHTNILNNIFTEKEVDELRKKLNKSNILKELYKS